MRLGDQGAEHMAALRVKAVARSVKVGRSCGEIVAAMLVPIGLGKLYASDLSDRVCLVGRLERAGKKSLFPDRLFGKLGVAAARREIKQPRNRSRMCGCDDIRGDQQIVVDEVGGAAGIRGYAADSSGRDDDNVRPRASDKTLHLALTAEVELFPADGQDLAILR